MFIENKRRWKNSTPAGVEGQFPTILYTHVMPLASVNHHPHLLQFPL